MSEPDELKQMIAQRREASKQMLDAAPLRALQRISAYAEQQSERPDNRALREGFKRVASRAEDAVQRRLDN